jgi:hypothetical protein
VTLNGCQALGDVNTHEADFSSSINSFVKRISIDLVENIVPGDVDRTSFATARANRELLSVLITTLA